MSNATRAQLRRFLVVGALTVLVDGAMYRALLLVGLPVALSKGTGFVTGSVFAYFANRAITFRSTARGARVFATFAAVYLTTLLVNVAANQLVLSALGFSERNALIAFLFATGLSASLNFLGMKRTVFVARSGT